MWDMVFVSVTAMMRTHLATRFWKTVHVATDSGTIWVLAIDVGATSLVTAVGTPRFLAGPNLPPRRKRVATATVLRVPA